VQNSASAYSLPTTRYSPPMADQNLKIQIDTTANTAGVQQAAAAVEKVGAGASKAAQGLDVVGKSSKDLARGLGEGAAVGNAAVAAMSNLATASQGGAGGLLAIARGAFAAGISMKGLLASMGPFGVIAAAIGVGLGLISTALRKNEEAAAAAKQKFDEAKAAGEALAKVNFEAMKTALEDINTALATEIARSKEVAAAQDEIAAAISKTAKAEIDAKEQNGRLTKERADLARAGIDAGADARAAKGRIESIQAELDAYKKAAAKAESYASLPEKAVISTSDELGRAEEARRNLSTAEIRKAAADKDFRNAYLSGGSYEWRSKASEERLAANKQYEAAKRLAPDESSDVNSERMKELRKAHEDAIAAWKPNAEAVVALNTKVDELTQKLTDRVSVEAKLKAEASKQAEAARMKPASIKEQATTALSDARMMEQGAATYLNRAAAGGAVDADQFARVFPTQAGKMDALLAKRNAEQAPNPSGGGTVTVGGVTQSFPAGGQAGPGTITDAFGRVRTATATTAGGGTISAGGVTQTFPAGGTAGQGRGAYREGGDMKAVADGLADATEAVNDTKKDSKDAGKAAEELSVAVQEMAKAQAQVTTSMTTGFSVSAENAAEAAKGIAEAMKRISALSERVSQLTRQMAAARAKK
jgi:hypothetical protein